jgi:hypothetical protein
VQPGFGDDPVAFDGRPRHLEGGGGDRRARLGSYSTIKVASIETPLAVAVIV